jgi:hypothetical protein
LGQGQDVHALDEVLVDACLDELKRRGPHGRFPNCGGIAGDIGENLASGFSLDEK